MKIAFFAARKIHRQYFSKLVSGLSHEDDLSAQVIWHKTLWMNFAWLLLTIQSSPPIELKNVVHDHIREKQNTLKGRQRTNSYWKVFRLIKHIETKLLFSIYKHALKQSKTTHLVTWNGLKFRQRIVGVAAESLNIQIIVMENGLLSGMTTLDNKGVNYLNSVPREPDFFIAQPTTENDTHQALVDHDDSLPKHYVFIPFQVNTDSQVVMFSPWLRDMFALVEALLIAEEHLGDKMPTIIMKTHPSCDQDYRELAQKIHCRSRKIQLRLSGNTQSMITQADAVATINSTVGIEAIAANIKTLVLGQAFYDIPGLTLSAHNQSELEKMLPLLNKFSPNQKIRRGLLNYLRNQYQIPGRWQKADEYHIKATCNRLIKEVKHCG